MLFVPRELKNSKEPLKVETLKIVFSASTMLKKGDIITLTIESLAFGGAGVGHIKQDERNFTVFVEDTVPGDEVKVRIGSRKKQYARGYIETLIKPSSKRIKPHCRHFSKQQEIPPEKQNCGGCSLQYLTYQDQLAIKEQHVRDAVVRIGELAEELVLPIIGCEEPWYYRNKMEFSFSRTLDGLLCLGLHQKRRHHDVVEQTECFLMESYIGDFVTAIRDFIRQWEQQNVQQSEGKLQSLIIREGKNTGEVMVNLVAENGKPQFLLEFTELVRNFFDKPASQKMPQNKETTADFLNTTLNFSRKLQSIYFTEITNQKGQRKQVREDLLWGEPVINEVLYIAESLKIDFSRGDTLGNQPKRSLHFSISPSAFFQPNTRQAQILFSLACAAAELTGKEVVYDLYCGAGTIGLSCAASALKVIGVELNPSAIEKAVENAQTNNIQNARFVAGNVLSLVDSFEEKPDIVMVDPPRNGLEPAVVEKIIELNPQRIVYVSCNPTSLARDLKIFAHNGYSIISIQPVDMFPQTYHIESVVKLENL